MIALATEFEPAHTPNNMKGTTYSYACETFSLTLLLKEFKDAVREGDGDRVMLVCKYLFLNLLAVPITQ